ncbi:hypothetical protein BH11MYX1_BH11MYX1_20330 [soil metagenome]
MSYLHCPTCRHAFNLAVTAECPQCAAKPIRAELADTARDIAAAADAIAIAMTRATPAERNAAASRITRIAPEARARPLVHAPSVIAPPAPRLLTRFAESLADRAAELATRAERRWAQVEPKVIAFLPRRVQRFRDRVRALAA